MTPRCFQLPVLPTMPKMQCDSDCGLCCVTSGGTEEEYHRILQYAEFKGVKPIKQGVRCPWWQHGNCQVYSVRPMICVLYGHTRDMVCPRGYNKNLPLAEEVRHMQDIIDAARKEGSPRMRFLHEVVYSFEEVKVFLKEQGIDWDDERSAEAISQSMHISKDIT